MEDPLFTDIIEIGGAAGNTTDYKSNSLGKRIHADQSFIWRLTLTDGNDASAYDLTTATANLFVSAYKNDAFTPILLAGGSLSDSGSGTVDRVTFIVAKDVIPSDLAQFPLRTPGNAVFFAIIQDGDSKIEIVNIVNVYDDSYGLTGESQPSASTIVPKGNDLGTVTDYLITTPPSPTLNLAYIVAPSSTGDWAGQDGNLAIGNGTSWIFFVSVEGNFAFDANSNDQILFDGTNWTEGLTSLDPLVLPEIAAPSSPSSGELAIYADSTTGLPTAKNSSGEVIQMGGGEYKTKTFIPSDMLSRATDGALAGEVELPSNNLNFKFFDFDSTTDEAVQLAFMMPDDWDLGTVKFKFIWTSATVASTGNVQWSAAAVAISNDDPLDVAFGTEQVVGDTFITALDNHTTVPSPAVTVSGSPTLADLVVFEFMREATHVNDTYAQDARLLNVTMQYKTLDTITAQW